MHHILAALHVRVLMIASDHLHAAGPVGRGGDSLLGQPQASPIKVFIIFITNVCVCGVGGKGQDAGRELHAETYNM